jgi:septum formation protein
MQVILGSQSPRRIEIMNYFKLQFKQASPPYDESLVPFKGDPKAYVCELSSGKAHSLVQKFPNDIILTADTIVYLEGKIYGKPKDENDAYKSLSELVGRWHTVYTGVTVMLGEKSYHQAEATQVLFNDLTPDQIRHYHSRLNWADKAGGYAIQLAGGLIVKKIDGCFYNVMGLPINTVEVLLKHFNIELWDYL